jgi:high-affinity K+ transport system ATPase subunit B
MAEYNVLVVTNRMMSLICDGKRRRRTLVGVVCEYLFVCESKTFLRMIVRSSFLTCWMETRTLNLGNLATLMIALAAPGC